MFKKKKEVQEAEVKAETTEQETTVPADAEVVYATAAAAPAEGPVSDAEDAAARAAANKDITFKEKLRAFGKKAWNAMKHSIGWTAIAVISAALLFYMILGDFFITIG